MGHYDDLYEQTDENSYDRKVTQYKEEISTSIDNMDIDDLKLLSKIATHIEQYRIFFHVLKRHNKA